MMREKVILVLALVCIVSGAALAMPVPGSTSQRWDFLTNANPAVPDVVDNPYAASPIEAAITYAGTTGVDPTWNDGVWSGSSVKFTVTVPNTDNTDPDSYKDMVVQIGYRGNISLAQVKVGEIPFGTIDREVSTYLKGNDIWTLVTDYYHIVPNPTSEYICYGFSDFLGGVQELDFVDIYTVCVPEPMTICLLGLGGLVISRRKK